MSTLAVNAVTDANGGNTATINSMTPTADSLQGFRNRIINGDMRIAQRGTAAVTTSDSFPVDRYKMSNVTDGAFSAIQDSSVPSSSGFVNSLKWTVTTADASIGADQWAVVRQVIEGNNCADLGWGASGAKTVTLSFWVRSSVTGTFGGALRNADANRTYPFTYSISAADTWEQKSVTVAGDTTGTWGTGTGAGITVFWSLAAGSNFAGTAGSWSANQYLGATGQTQLMSTLNATWYITGVQLEVGSVATPFERRPYGTELALCQRYCYTLFATDCATDNFARFALGDCDLTDRLQGYVWFPVTMRVAPSLTATAANTFTLYSAGATNTCTQVNVAPTVTSKIGLTQLITSATLTVGRAGQILANNNRTAYLIYSAEL